MTRAPRARRPKIPDASIVAYSQILRRALRGAEEAIESILAPHLDASGVRYGLRVVSADVDPDEIAAIGARVDRANLKEIRATLPARLLARVSSGVPKKTLDRFRKTNVDLIKSLVGNELEEITGILDDGFKAGTRVEDLRKQIRERFDVTRSKADLLARDQVLKLNAQITQTRQRQAGISEYRWSASQDERVREYHRELDGSIFRWDDPPITNEDGDRNAPGEDYQCRCVAIPILPPLDAGEEDG